MSAAKVSPAGAKPATTTVPCHTRHPVPPRRSAGRRRARLLHHGQRMLGLRAGHDLRLRDAGLPAALSVLDPFLRQVQPAIDRDLPLGAARGSEHPGLTILQLAQSAAPLARHAGRVLTLLHPSSRSRTHRSAGNLALDPGARHDGTDDAAPNGDSFIPRQALRRAVRTAAEPASGLSQSFTECTQSFTETAKFVIRAARIGRALRTGAERQ